MWLSLVLALIVCRLLPYALPRVVHYLVPAIDHRMLAYYLFNVTPLGAACVFSGAVLASARQAFLLPLAVWVISDTLLTWMGWAPIPGVRHVLIQYPLFLAMSGLGRWWLHRRRTTWRVLGTCLASGLLFLLVVDAQTWWFSPDVPLPPHMPDSYWQRLLYAFSPGSFLGLGGYPKTLDGLITCYLMGLPFSLRFVGSTLAFGWVFFAAYTWAEQRAVVWRSWGQTQPASLTR